MIMLAPFQITVAAAALVACALASSNAIRNRSTGLDLILAGTFALIFFLTIAAVRYELIAAALLTVFTGFVLTPRVEIGEDSTIRRRPR